jgi:hypothetical protein
MDFWKFGSPETQISRNLNIRRLNLWKFGFSETQILRNPSIRRPDFWKSGFLEIQISGYPDFKKSRYPDTRIYCNPGLRISGITKITGWPGKTRDDLNVIKLLYAVAVTLDIVC